jgi:hypothetical protein
LGLPGGLAMRTSLLLSLSCLLIACSSTPSTDDGGANDSGPKDATTDVRVDGGPKDASGDAADAAPVDDAGDAAIDPDAGFECMKPTDCMNNNVCCGTLVTGAGQPPNCPISSYGTKCTAANQCATNIPFTCSSTGTVRACSSSADCTEAQYGQCCTFMQNMQSASFCVNQVIAQFASSCN